MLSLVKNKLQNIRSLLFKDNSGVYLGVSDIYTVEEYISTTKEMEEYNSLFISFFEKILEIKILKVQYVITKNEKLGLKLIEYTGEINKLEVSQVLESSDYLYEDNQFIIYMN